MRLYIHNIAAGVVAYICDAIGWGEHIREFRCGDCGVLPVPKVLIQRGTEQSLDS